MKWTYGVAIILLWWQSAICGAQGKVVNVGDASINYEMSGAGKTLVFIHGWAQDLGTWDDQTTFFAPHFRVLRYDRRGFGKSTGYADISADAADLAALLDSLGIRTASIVGLSAGAESALRFALNYPERVEKLVLYGKGPVVGFPKQPRPSGPPPVFVDIARKYGMDSVRKAILGHPIAWTPPERPELRRRMAVDLARYEGRDLLNPRPPSGKIPPADLDSLRNVKAPTLVINGDHEMALGLAIADTLVTRLPNARKVVITNAGHGAHFAQPASFNSALMIFLREAGPKKTP